MASSRVVVGVDEAGAGPAFGSLWAAAVQLTAPVEGLRDSKKLTERKRAALREAVLATARVGMGEVTKDEIDGMGMAECRRLVFERALDDFVAANGGLVPDHVLVDGRLYRPWRGVPFECHDRAEDAFPEVAAASVLAKTTRDAQVLAWCEADPSLHAKYAIRSNKGYLSPAHLAGLKEHGWSPLHRTSYRVRGVGEGASP